MDKHVDVRLDLFFTAAIFVAIVMNIIILSVVFAKVDALKQPCTEQTK